jgi:hypothetical protein
MSHSIGVWIAALLTLGIFSFLYKDNPFYKLCESIFLGVSAGYWFVSLFWQNIWSKLIQTLIGGNSGDAAAAYGPYAFWLYLPAAILGVMMLLRLAPRIGWISRWPLAFIVGSTAGLYFITYLQSNAINQIHDTLVPLIGGGRGSLAGIPLPFHIDWAGLFIFAGTFSGLVYFFFSLEHRRLTGKVARVGIFFLMVTFGASFGYTVMSRMSLLIGRMDFLVGDWLGLVR